MEGLGWTLQGQEGHSLTRSEERKKVMDSIRDLKPPLELLTARSELPAPPTEIIRGLLDACKFYGEIPGFGYNRLSFDRQKYWSSLNYTTVLTFACFGLRTSEANVLFRSDFYFDPFAQTGHDNPPYVAIYKADTRDGKPKARSERFVPIPTRAIPLFKRNFDKMALFDNDYILSGRGSRFDEPIRVGPLEQRFKGIGMAAAKKFPELKIPADGSTCYPYICRKFLGTMITSQRKDGGVMAGAILGHRPRGAGPKSRTTLDFYVRFSMPEKLEALDAALADVLPEFPPREETEGERLRRLFDERKANLRE